MRDAKMILTRCVKMTLHNCVRMTLRMSKNDLAMIVSK